ncbi:MAG: hypothetical protein HN929_13795 [Chloroflexi bacterium]|jgi:hypothetical protein|nr:hypothetical protein [Chloroflexota bacterium]MBT7082510.1 hypothetical protein [Chloroflexota bacterium]MBT7289211.1 hypothetical protein [Chloroflexota bacterium]
MESITIEATTTSNRLYMNLSGFFTDDDMQHVYDKFANEAKKLKKGFDVITDTSQFKPITQKGATIINKTQQLAKESW